VGADKPKTLKRNGADDFFQSQPARIKKARFVMAGSTIVQLEQLGFKFQLSHNPPGKKTMHVSAATTEKIVTAMTREMA
jgi:hypothetical protein